MPYPKLDKPLVTRKLPANIRMKEIYVGSKQRRFKRVPYEPNVGIMLSEDSTESSETVDISKGGVCIITKASLIADSEVDIKFELPENKKIIHTKARVTWIRNLDQLPEENITRCKVGLEFIKLKAKDRKLLLEELKV